MGTEMRAQATPGNEVTSSHQNPSTAATPCSHDSLSLGDHGQTFQTGESSYTASIVTDNEPFWDWEQLEWCYSDRDNIEKVQSAQLIKEKEVVLYMDIKNNFTFHFHM